MLLNLIFSTVVNCWLYRNKLYMKKKDSVSRRLITLTIKTALVRGFVVMQ